jgi:hypothetical protein
LPLNKWTNLFIFVSRCNIKPFGLIAFIDFVRCSVLRLNVRLVIAVFVVALIRLIHAFTICVVKGRIVRLMVGMLNRHVSLLNGRLIDC